MAVCRTEEYAYKNEQNLSGKHVHKVSNNLENMRFVLLKDDIPKENHHGNMAEMTATLQQKEVKANQTIQIVFVVDIIILENRARQKQSTATTVTRWDTLRNNVE